MYKGYKVLNQSDGSAEILVYGDILPERDFYEQLCETETNSTVLKEFLEELDELKGVPNITVRINSMGGDVFTAHAIYTRLKMCASNITVVVDGIAASAASVVAMAGDKIIMPRNALMMIHDPMVGVCGYYNETELASLTDLLIKIKSSISTTYQSKSGMPVADIEELMRKETWLTADEALALGLIDEVLDFDSTALADESITDTTQTHFSNTPKQLFAAKVKHKEVKSMQSALSKLFSKQPIATAPKQQQPTVVDVTSAEELATRYPELCNELVVSAINMERERIKGIEAIAGNIPAELVQSAKFDNAIDAKELALLAMQKSALAAKNHMANAVSDSISSGVMDIGVAPIVDVPKQPVSNFADKLAEITAQLNKRLYK